MVDKTKTKTKKPKNPKQNRRAKKYVGRDNIKDKSIKININTGGSGKSSNAPPSVNVYPQQQAQHLIRDRNDKTPLIDDKVGNSNLMQLMLQHDTKISDLSKVVRSGYTNTIGLINSSADETNRLIGDNASELRT